MTARQLLTHGPADDPGEAVVRDDCKMAVGRAVSPLLFGTFCEHLGTNIYQGMEAQVLLNPTFGYWALVVDTDHPDGGIEARHEADRDAIYVVLVNRRSSSDPIECTLEAGETTAESVEVTQLVGETMHAENTYEIPDRVAPETDSAAIRDGELELTLSPCWLTRVTIPRAGAGGQ
jgi:alpha-L-arabinofuranosidase